MLHGYDIQIPDDMVDDEGKKYDWCEDSFGFINDVIMGIEKEVYKQAQGNKSLKDNIKETNGMLVGMRLIEFYLIQVYKQLVDKESDIIVEKFTKIGEACDEKPVFMLNLITNVINKCYPMMPRSKLDPTDEEKYRASVAIVLQLMKKYIVTMLNEFLQKLKEAKKTVKAQENAE